MKRYLNQLNEPSRRAFLAQAATAAFGVSLSPSSAGDAEWAVGETSRRASCDNVIFLYMTGGMSQVETFDPKSGPHIFAPGDAVQTSVSGVRFGAGMQNLAPLMDRMTVIRSMTSTSGDHGSAMYRMMTGFDFETGIQYSRIGTWADYFLGVRSSEIPSSVVIGGENPGAGLFESHLSPFPIPDPNRGLDHLLPKLPMDEVVRRAKVSQLFAKSYYSNKPDRNVKAYSSFFESTLNFFDGSGARAFDLSVENAKVRASYGDGRFGQGCCLARRLVEHGARYVEVAFDQNWDGMHGNVELHQGYTANMDRAVAALISDLEKRGMLDRTMVVLTTEFGRTPFKGKGYGRDHQPQAFSAMIAGGGARHGYVYGGTDDAGRTNEAEGIEAGELHATIAYAMGLPLEQRIHAAGGRPFFVGDRNSPALDLLL